ALRPRVPRRQAGKVAVRNRIRPACEDASRWARSGAAAMTAYNPRREAFERLDGRYEVRVLEPSPPAVQEGPWYADDPAAVGEVPPGRQVVTPTTAGDVSWDELAARDSELAGWCAERWLGAWRDLRPLPQRLAMTRLSF